mmetsp:Transcript_19943/g.64920  ORF Transcript_19943/g.64920 Transcript_19943/m.64920 type:complete len:183 (-) Transcript_19943:1284-1832(-)
MESVQLTAGPTLYVWDFDKTILSIHAFALRLTPEDAQTRDLEEDCVDLAFFRAFVANVLRRGAKVAVASFGSYEVIQAYLDRIAPGVFTRENISTPASVGGRDGSSISEGKVPQLEQLVRSLLAGEGGGVGQVNVMLRKQVLFFDDQLPNIKMARNAGFVGSFHTPEGFSRECWSNVYRQLS